jgi:hypothetical protein
MNQQICHIVVGNLDDIFIYAKNVQRVMTMQHCKMRRLKPALKVLYVKFCLLVFMLCQAGTLYANPADYIFTPIVEYGEREFDFKAGTVLPQGRNRAQGISLGYGYGATEYWFTEVYLKQEYSGSYNANLAEWENKFQLTETGSYPVDIGLITELEAPLDKDARWDLTIGPLFQTEFGKLQLNGNLLLERQFGKTIDTITDFNYQWQAKYRWQPVLEFGMQGLGDLGKWNHWNSQANQFHRFGPALFGKFVLGNRQAIKYNAAWLLRVSTSAHSANHTLRMQVEYEF